MHTVARALSEGEKDPCEWCFSSMVPAQSLYRNVSLSLASPGWIFPSQLNKRYSFLVCSHFKTLRCSTSEDGTCFGFRASCVGVGGGPQSMSRTPIGGTQIWAVKTSSDAGLTWSWLSERPPSRRTRAASSPGAWCCIAGLTESCLQNGTTGTRSHLHWRGDDRGRVSKRVAR